MVITEGIGLGNCEPKTCTSSGGLRVVGSFNNITFVTPQTAILQAYYGNIAGVYTTDFPSNPPLVFDYTATNQRQDILFPESGTKAKVLPFHSTVQIVFQGNSILSNESHPVHMHGHDFYVVGQGFGNYNPQNDTKNFNLKDPPQRNTIGVPFGGWVAIRFTGDDPGGSSFCDTKNMKEIGDDIKHNKDSSFERCEMESEGYFLFHGLRRYGVTF